MKGDENLAEVQLSGAFLDALTGGRVADRVDGKSEAFDRAGRLPSRPQEFGSLVGQPILAAAGFQPASSAADEFLGLRGATLEEHEPKETSATADLSRFENRLKGGCLEFGLSCGRHDCLPHKAIACMPRMAKAERAA
jgi:hypothetical protein